MKMFIIILSLLLCSSAQAETRSSTNENIWHKNPLVRFGIYNDEVEQLVRTINADNEAVIVNKLLSNYEYFDGIERLIHKMDSELEDIYERDRITNIYEGMGSGQSLTMAMEAVNVWCDKYPNSHIAFTAKGYIYCDLAWRYRGGKYANEVSLEDMQHFKESLLIAEEALKRAYELNTNTSFAATKMITVTMGLCQPREEMEKWFKRATSVPLKENFPYGCKALYLQPIWHGSIAELLAYVYAIDNTETPVMSVATTYATIWQKLPYRDTALGANKEFLNKAALAYDRYIAKYPQSPSGKLACAFFACKAGNYQLAAKYFPQLEWTEKCILFEFWKSKEEFEMDRSHVMNSRQELRHTEEKLSR